MDDPLSLLSLVIWLMAAGMYPLGFLFGACSPCCDSRCQWILSFDRCMKWEVVDSDPPVGGDIVVSPQLVTSFATGTLSRDERMESTWLTIHNLWSQVRVNVAVSISAGGESRTTVGETRSQVWRFVRQDVPQAEQPQYDVIGPPWHLQVDISVTGVATSEESGVISSLSEDEHGQVKLVVHINQWTQTITHNQAVTLRPVGVQRWIQYRLTTSSATASLVSGDAVSGWSVSRTGNIAVDERELAVQIPTTFSLPYTFNQRPRRTILLDENNAVAFLNGEESVRSPRVSSGVSAAEIGGELEFAIAPDNPICQIRADALHIGIPLGIYPEFLTLNVPDSFVDAVDQRLANVGGDGFLTSTPQWCGPSRQLPLRPNGDCATVWQPSYYRRHLSITAIHPLANVPVGPSTFYSGVSLLFNAERGPYRTSASVAGPENAIYEIQPGTPGFPPQTSDWVVELGGEGEFSLHNAPPAIYTALTSGGFFLTNAAICLPGFTSLTSGSQTQTWLCLPEQTTVVLSVQDGTNVSITATPFIGGGLNGALVAQIAGAIPVGSPSHPNGLSIILRGEIPCDASGEIALTLRTDVQQPFGAPTNVTLVSPQSIPYHEGLRITCTNWNVDVIPPAGATITRSCENNSGLFGGSSPGPVATSKAYQATRLTLPRLIAGDSSGTQSILRARNCRLLGVTPPGQASVLSATIMYGMQAGECLHYHPAFGNLATSTDGDVCSGSDGPAVRLRSVPCEPCEPSVSVVSGSENARVTYITTGQKAGLIEVVALRTWLGGQGVVFTVVCGGESVTQTIRRNDTVPTAPRNLTVTRGPCSEALLQWDAPEWNGGQPITAYNIQFRRIGDSYETFGTVSPPTLSAVLTGLVRVGYDFRVSATNSVGTSAFSNVVIDGFALAAPAGLTFTRHSPCTSLQLAWTAPATAECVVVASYIVQIRVVGENNFTTAATLNGNAVNYTIEGLMSGTRYQFRVGSVDDANIQRFTPTLTSGNAPATPTGVTRAIGSNPDEVDVAWSAIEESCFENTLYLVQFRPSTTSTWSNGPTSVNKFATVTGLTAGVTYFFRVRATNSVGNSGFSAQSASITMPLA